MSLERTFKTGCRTPWLWEAVEKWGLETRSLSLAMVRKIWTRATVTKELGSTFSATRCRFARTIELVQLMGMCGGAANVECLSMWRNDKRFYWVVFGDFFSLIRGSNICYAWWTKFICPIYRQYFFSYIIVINALIYLRHNLQACLLYSLKTFFFQFWKFKLLYTIFFFITFNVFIAIILLLFHNLKDIYEKMPLVFKSNCTVYFWIVCFNLTIFGTIPVKKSSF